MVSHLCLFSINVHAVPNADHAWAPADMKAAAGLQFIINVHAVLYADHAWAPCDMKVAAALQFMSDKLFFPNQHSAVSNGLMTNLAKHKHDKWS